MVSGSSWEPAPSPSFCCFANPFGIFTSVLTLCLALEIADPVLQCLLWLRLCIPWGPDFQYVPVCTLPNSRQLMPHSRAPPKPQSEYAPGLGPRDDPRIHSHISLPSTVGKPLFLLSSEEEAGHQIKLILGHTGMARTHSVHKGAS